MSYDAAREAIAEQLLADAAAHDRAHFDEIGRRFDTLERAFPYGSEAALGKLRIALTFWDGWIDARNRGWQPTRGIQPNEWPAVARRIAAELLADQEISDTRVRARFDATEARAGSDRVHGLSERLRDRDLPGTWRSPGR
jgi:hypothetical protein